MAAIEALGVEELHSSDMEMGHGGGSDEEDEDALDPELKNMLKIKDGKPEKEKKHRKKMLGTWLAVSEMKTMLGASSQRCSSSRRNSARMLPLWN